MNNALLAIVFLFLLVPQQSSAQNPSPIIGHTRAHKRVSQSEPRGRRVDLKSLKGARLFVTEKVNPEKPVPLVIHFHGVPWLIETHIANSLPQAALITVNLGAGSNAYRQPFELGEIFPALLDEAGSELELKRGWSSVTLSGFSAGYGAVREILRQPEYVGMVDNVLLLDGMHTSYIPEGKPISAGGVIDSGGLDSFIKFAQKAVLGRKRFVFTHSEIFPGTYASTTECADYLLAELRSDSWLSRQTRRKLKRRAELRTGAMGMQQLSTLDVGGLHVRGYAGNTAPDHVDHLHAMPAWFPLLGLKKQ